MDIGEAVSIAVLTDSVDECPFDHSLDDPPEVENDLVGVGTTLASRMKTGKSTKLYGDYKPKSITKVLKPRERKNHPFYNKAKCIPVKFSDGTEQSYPVTSAAHHAIPAQESLRESELLLYMCKVGTSEEKNHNYADGIVWSNIGYDVNGGENGIFLPGTYAVGGGTGGLKVWYPTDNPDDEEEVIEVDEMPRDSSYNDFLLYGGKGDISEENGCWWYVKQAMLKCPGQFHDRHIFYSEQVVLKALNVIAEKLLVFNVMANENSCGDCKERRDKIEEFGLPTPYSLVNRLEFLSNKLKTFLTARPRSWRENVYTSMWAKAYMDAIKAGGRKKSAAEMFE
ncbi:MAG: hypothetical protein OEX19_00425 [Gammaproteobacteria bacterium]|nr:hypothetical protein [Gammaproteobacteria bacterium]